jgi:hypothetical protein
MDVDGRPCERHWDEPERNETETERLDRNWATLLQELRVVQTGVQLLTGLLLTLPFHEAFEDLPPNLRLVYLTTVGCSVISTVLLASPVATHRLLFRRKRLAQVVLTAHRMTFWGLMLLGLSLVGVVVLVFGTVAGDLTGFIAGAVALVGFVVFWVILPLSMRDRADAPRT